MIYCHQLLRNQDKVLHSPLSISPSLPSDFKLSGQGTPLFSVSMSSFPNDSPLFWLELSLSLCHQQNHSLETDEKDLNVVECSPLD